MKKKYKIIILGVVIGLATAPMTTRFWFAFPVELFFHIQNAGRDPSPADLDALKGVVKKINAGDLSINPKSEAPPHANDPPNWPSYATEPADGSLHKIRLPESMKSLTVDGYIIVSRSDSNQFQIIFKTSTTISHFGGDDEMWKGFLYTSSPFTSSDIIQNASGRIEYRPANIALWDNLSLYDHVLAMEKTSDPQWYKVSYFSRSG